MTWLVVLLVVLVVDFFLFRGAAKKTPLLTAIVDIPETAPPAVSLTPDPGGPMDLIQSMLSYGTN